MWNIHNQAHCHAKIDPLPFANAGSTWDYESYNQVGGSLWEWFTTICGNRNQPVR